MYLSKSLLTNKASRHFTFADAAAGIAIVSLENTALPLSVYEVTPLAALAQPINCALEYSLPDLLIENPVISFKPISTDASA